jgi:hypothetical protein
MVAEAAATELVVRRLSLPVWSAATIRLIEGAIMPSRKAQIPNVKPLYGVMIVVACGAFACAFFGGGDLYLFVMSSKEPEELSLHDLIRRGPYGNPNILLKDFVVLDNFVFETKRSQNRWEKVWAPLVPAEGNDRDDASVIRAFLYSDNVGNAEEAEERFGHPKVRGIANPFGPKPGFRAFAAMTKAYPGTDIHKCVIFEVGREPPGMLRLILFGAGFVLSLIVLAALWRLARQMSRMPAEPFKAKSVDEGN